MLLYVSGRWYSRGAVDAPEYVRGGSPTPTTVGVVTTACWYSTAPPPMAAAAGVRTPLLPG
eukprot:COSAG05_NODE_1172_length_5623_cov_3.561188_5_plen_61_part_00